MHDPVYYYGYANPDGGGGGGRESGGSSVAAGRAAQARYQMQQANIRFRNTSLPYTYAPSVTRR